MAAWLLQFCFKKLVRTHTELLWFAFCSHTRVGEMGVWAQGVLLFGSSRGASVWGGGVERSCVCVV